MRIVMHAEMDIEVVEFLAPEMEVVSADPELAYSALQMFATSLALCSFSVLYAYGEQLGVAADLITIRVRWSVLDDEGRIDDLAMEVFWPNLPESRQAAASRAAAQCTLHRTLEQPPRLATHVRTR